MSPRGDATPAGIGLSALVVTTADEDVSRHAARRSPVDLTLKTTYKYVSDSILDILGYQPEDLIGKSAYLVFHPEEIPYLREIH